MRSHRVTIRLLTLSALICANIWAQAAGPPQTAPSDSAQTTATAAPSASSTPSWTSIGKVNFSAMVDGYYSFNNNHPSSEFNELYNFNDKTNQVDLNLLKLTASADPAPVGFRVDIGLGRVFDIIHSVKQDPE